MSFKRRLAIELEKLKGFKKPKIWLEQYVTPAHLVAEIVNSAETIGDLKNVSTILDEVKNVGSYVDTRGNAPMNLDNATATAHNKQFINTSSTINGVGLATTQKEPRVIDLGCGTGIISIAFELCGYKSVGFDIDVDAIRVARENARLLGLKTDFIVCDVKNIKIVGRHLVVMNPPFGIKRRHADRCFLKKAFEIGEVIYSIHSAGSEGFIRNLSKDRGFEVTHVWRYKIPLKRTYNFHEKEFKQIAIEVYRIERRS